MEKITPSAAMNASNPDAGQWVSSPLRNRLQLKLERSPEHVWALVGDPASMPQYSEGLVKVDTQFDEEGNCTGYTCFFKPMQGAPQGIEHFSAIVWHEQNKGWASVDGENNPFGTFRSLSLMTLQPEGDATLFTWDFHYDCSGEESLNANREGYQIALDDISRRLIKRFGGRELTNYADRRQNG